MGSISTDSGPERVALVLDVSRQVPETEWKLETEMAATLVKNARQGDSFALVLTGQETTPLPFESSGDIQRKLDEMRSNRPLASDETERNYDALKAAASSLSPPRFGDVIFLFGHPEDHGSATTFDEIKQVVLEGGTRFYGVGFTDALIPGKLDELVYSTGYFFSYHSLRSLAFPGQTQLFRDFLGDLYTGMYCYPLKLDSLLR